MSCKTLLAVGCRRMVQQNQTSAKVDRQSIMLPWGAYESVKKLLDD